MEAGRIKIKILKMEKLNLEAYTVKLTYIQPNYIFFDWIIGGSLVKIIKNLQEKHNFDDSILNIDNIYNIKIDSVIFNTSIDTVTNSIFHDLHKNKTQEYKLLRLRDIEVL